MKICTITCHDVYNHGASLQAYALMRYLERMGHDVEIIDYKPEYLSGHYDLFAIHNHRWEKNIVTKIIYLLLKMPTRIMSLKRKVEFDNFTKKYMRLTNTKYRSNEELKKNIPDSDIYMCGSDQIWNSLHKNGKDRAFYLDFVPDNKIKASYAASFATDSIQKELKQMVKELTSRLDGVGVREHSGVKILKDLGVEKAINVVDPVFLLGKNEWNKIGDKRYKDKYVLVYDFDKNPLIEKLAKDIAKEKGYKIYTISNYKAGYENRSFRYNGPETFVSLIKNAEFIVSNSFHAAVFSIIYEKQVAIINRVEAINTRMRDLLELLDMKSRVIDENYSIDSVLKEIDYKNVIRKLNKEIQYSKNYLNEVIAIKK